jgi:hypothetical protein
MEQYFSPANTKGKQKQTKVLKVQVKERKYQMMMTIISQQKKKLKTTGAPNPQWLQTHEWYII